MPLFPADDKSRRLVHRQSYDLRGITVSGAHYAEKQVLPHYLRPIKLFFAPSPVNYRKVIINEPPKFLIHYIIPGDIHDFSITR